MAYYGTQLQRFGLAKEATRGTSESAPTKWYQTRGRAELNYALQHLEDQGIRGISAKLPPLAGTKVGDGKIPLYCDAQMLGELCYSLFGGVSSAQQAATVAYKHTFTRAATITPQSYTFFLDRNMNVLKYNNGVVKRLGFKSSVNGLIEVEADVLFKSEASGSIGSPTFPTQKYGSFQQVAVTIAGGASTDVKEWEVNIDNGAKPFRTLAGSQDVNDIVAPDPMTVDGSMLVYFQNATERDKFIANTSVALRFLVEGATIASTYKYTTDINIYDARYKAFPYGEDEGLLAAQAQFEGFYSTSDSKQVQIDLTNTDEEY